MRLTLLNSNGPPAAFGLPQGCVGGSTCGPTEHNCGGSCACTTCHCIIREGFESLNEADELEEDLLDKAWGLEAQSRLSCQAIVGEEDLTVEIPKYSLNHAAEAPH